MVDTSASVGVAALLLYLFFCVKLLSVPNADKSKGKCIPDTYLVPVCYRCRVYLMQCAAVVAVINCSSGY